MIILWIKITYYKIIKVFRNRRETGTETVSPRARHAALIPSRHTCHDRTTRPGPDWECPHCSGRSAAQVLRGELGVAVDPARRDGIVGYTREPGAPDDTIKTERLRRLIELGLVSEPDGFGDMIRITDFHEEWARREAGDPSACPCAGRHYPSSDACRWCRCHDLQNVHHTEGARTIMQVMKPLADDAARELARDAREVFEEIIDARQKIESSVRPSNEIVCCPGCGHPQHTFGSGRCAFLSSLGEGFQVCHCDHDTETGEQS